MAPEPAIQSCDYGQLILYYDSCQIDHNMYVYYPVRQGQDGWILTKFFFLFLLKERGQCTAILTKQTWSIRDLLYGQFCNVNIDVNFSLMSQKMKEGYLGYHACQVP